MQLCPFTICLQNLSDIGFDLLRSAKVKGRGPEAPEKRQFFWEVEGWRGESNRNVKG